MAKTALHDWVCDTCGRKIYKRRKVPMRCHSVPMRPMGSPWKYVTETFYDKFSAARIRELPDGYWVSAGVMERLQQIVTERGVQWDGSCRGKGPHSAEKYEDLP